MEFSFDNDSILNRCKVLASYEGRNAIDGDGESAYSKTVIGEQDESLITGYIRQGAEILVGIIGNAVESSNYSDSGFSYTMTVDEARWHNNPTLQKYIFEAIVSYVMKMWLEYNSNQRTESYSQVWESMAQVCKKESYKKSKPVLS